jgi:hypothetical protein
MYEAVDSSVAKDLWDNGSCSQPAERSFDALSRKTGISYLIAFP